MSRIGFLRRQAEFYLRCSQGCSDPQEAGRLRLVAAEFFRRASEAEGNPASVETPTDRGQTPGAG